MTNERMLAFSDGVIAIIITIMVLELKVPRGADLAALLPVLSVFFSYVLSFIYVGIYWNNHHHMMHACVEVTGRILWANLSWLFWLSLFPFATAWMGEYPSAVAPSAVYGGVLLMAAATYQLLQRVIIRTQGSDSLLSQAVGNDWKGKLSPVFYLLGIAAAFWSPHLSQGLYLFMAAVWFVPDRRIEQRLAKSRSRRVDAPRD
jgi:uncharacterized membrane protein